MHPILYQAGPFTLRSYGALMALSFVLGILLSSWLNRKDGRGDEVILDVSTWIMLGAVAGARLLYVVVQPDSYKLEPWRIIFVWEGGLVYYGGLLGGAFAAYAYLRRQALPIWDVGDCLAPGLALGQVTGRLGCWFNACCYGRVDAEHGVVFPALGDGLPHLPTQLYEAGYCLLLAAFLTWFWFRKRFAGQVFWVYILLYALFRFGIEGLRGDVERGTLVSAALSPSQWLSLLGLGLALAMLLRPRKAA